MRIVFFGSSHGIPEPNRKCSSILLETGNKRYFIDMGTQSIEGLISRNMPVESVKGIFITHMHGDHIDGLVSYIDLCNWYFKTANPIVYLPGDVENTVKALKAWIKCAGNEMRDFDFRHVEDGVVYEEDCIKVTAFKTCHTDSSRAYLIEAEGKRVLFTGDLRNPKDDFPKSVLERHLDLAICECAHFPVSDYFPLFENCDNLKEICFNHYSDRYLPEILKYKQSVTDKNITVAADGMEITI